MNHQYYSFQAIHNNRCNLSLCFTLVIVKVKKNLKTQNLNYDNDNFIFIKKSAKNYVKLKNNFFMLAEFMQCVEKLLYLNIIYHKNFKNQNLTH